jgi:hypothetical protein
MILVRLLDLMLLYKRAASMIRNLKSTALEWDDYSRKSHPVLMFPRTVEAATASRMTSTTGFGAVTSGV